MEENKYRLWDTGFKFATTLISVLVVLIGVWEFSKEQRDLKNLEYELIAKKDSIDFHKKLWETKVRVYSKICTTAADILVNLENETVFKQALMEFEKLYYGETIFVEDQAVEEKMIDFRLACYDFQNQLISTWELKTAGNEMIVACRKSAEQELTYKPTKNSN